ncbi:MAG TPA: dihydrolipoyl dehydrogenase [Victivallales bacterium]|nr:dihydrolipoyl dehydrogenase [Victivallales bacterium]HRU00306.1 dihydrolipoyl dehydrogenase [Victivallales bacterium]
MKNDFDVCVIGAGPGGYVAAIRAAQLGAKTALIEKDFPGGTCLNWGCIPTKTLIASTELYKKIKEADKFGIKIDGDVKADWSAILTRKNEIVKKLRNGILSLLKSARVEYIEGVAKFAERKKIQIKQNNGKEIHVKADKIIIATGSESVYPAFIPKTERIYTSTELLDIKEIPESLIILGGGVIGCEFASMFASLGTKITILEMLPEILSVCDKEIIKLAVNEMKKMGIEIHTGSKVERVLKKENCILCETAEGEFIASHMLVAVGRRASLTSLDIEKAGLQVNEKGFIQVDSKCRTSVPGIFAIGDLTGRIQLAHMASAMGICAAENACGNFYEFRDNLVPNCIFTSPEIASVGLTESECKNRGIDYRIGNFPFAALGKAMAIGDYVGFCKIIADAQTDQVLGVHIIGPHATDLIAEAATAMNLEITAEELGKAIHAHPTLPEALMEAAHDIHKSSVHIPYRKK